MSEHYNQNYTEEEVGVILQKIKACVSSNRFVISQNEQTNQISFQVINRNHEGGLHDG